MDDPTVIAMREAERANPVPGWEPRRDILLIKPLERSRQTKSGLHLPEVDANSQKVNEGYVVKAGPGLRNENGEIEPMQSKVGDCVVFSDYAGSDWRTDEGVIYRILRDGEIIGSYPSG